MDEHPDLKWRIDAWDSLAGRAFLCRRLPEGADAPQLDQSAIFVSPPFFQPEPLASRAPGFAATRGTLQCGLFIDGQEAGFATLDDAIAFIRRGYNSPGSEPFPGAPITARVGPGGRGGSGLALELPELPMTSAFKKLDLAIGERIQKFVALPGEVTPKNPTPHMDWTLEDSSALQCGNHLLSFAAAELMLELLQRFPAAGAPEHQSAWFDSAHRLGLQTVRLGAWDDAVMICTACLKHQSHKRLIDLFSIDPKEQGFAEHAGDGNFYSVLLEVLFLGRKGRYWQRWALEQGEQANAYDDLALFPLPRRMSSRYHGPDSSPTVLTLLSSWFAYPASIEDTTGLDRALLLFGGACVAVSALRQESISYRPSLNNLSEQLREAFYLRVTTAAWQWISSQLPDRAFEWKLENTLRHIPQMWAHAKSAPGSSPRPPEDLNWKLAEAEFEIPEAAYPEQNEENTATQALTYKY